ncbi:terpene synthase family protein [Algoriphagus winogradskyi]|uniref:Terpene synthase n=1 Tax=Algoriphagus winogradskyi TaxID=237017 RepID=A0ABY1P4F7_9BACT|nr:terpene synthase family protein [Algoriphagus winogradskyi]SMP26274.1 Terpene synthase family, metal binding domain [Algoriphagus winogradskyi]
MKTSHEFPVAINLHCKAIDVKVLKWAWEAGLFESPAEFERCRIQKINWFAGYLFPEEDAERLELIMKFFLSLFLLDDLLDIGSDRSLIEFLEDLKTGNSIHSSNRLHSLGYALLLLHKEIEQKYAVSYESEQWYNAWLEYLQALQWEVRIKMEGIKPELEEYRIYRPKSSGVYLAMILNRQGKDMRGCLAEFLEFSMARYIYLSNDLASYEKELAIGDTHNEIIILLESMGDTAISWVKQELRQLRKRILALTKQACISFQGCEEWIRRLLLLAGGCEAWTAETSRYQNYINGKLGAH